MAQVTVELGRLLNKTNFKLFDFEYQFDDADYKKVIEDDLIQFFYDYEIGQETPDMFKRKFIARWKRIIPYYNKLYNTTLLSYNPLINSSMSEALEQLSTAGNTTDSTSDSTGNVHTFSDSDTKTSDYPQQAIAGGDYLNGASNTISDATSDSTGKVTGKVTATTTANSEYTKTIEGLSGTSYQELIQKQREILIQINVMLINEMKPCFILVY
jgi:hypothetical protein